jgi:hypothetical protein
MSYKPDEAESGIVSKFNDDLMGVICRALDAEEGGGVRSEVILDRMVRVLMLHTVALGHASGCTSAELRELLGRLDYAARSCLAEPIDAGSKFKPAHIGHRFHFAEERAIDSALRWFRRIKAPRIKLSAVVDRVRAKCPGMDPECIRIEIERRMRRMRERVPAAPG